MHGGSSRGGDQRRALPAVDLVFGSPAIARVAELVERRAP